MILAVTVALALGACAQSTPTPQRPAAGGNRPGAAPAADTAPAGGRGGQAVAPQAGGGRGGQAGAAGAQEPSPQPYDRVVTAEAQTRTGLFKTHRINARLLFEIPRAQLDKDILLVTEIARTVLGSGYGGQAAGNRVLRLERREHRVLLRSVSYEVMADPATPEYQAVQSANVSPIIAAYNVEAYGPDSSMVIDVSRTFTQPPAELGPGARIPGTIDAARSFIDRAVPFPDNVNVYATLTYAQAAAAAGRGAAPAPSPFGTTTNTNPSNTIQMSWSFHRLPDTPLMPRLCDDRVGYFSVTFTNFTETGDRVREKCFITRYRLEKKDPNAAVSDPVRPIVYYIDPATPRRWIPYFKRGIEAWQKAFLEAGFSNAIVAREAPSDPDWSPEDARYSVVRWLPSTVENASGPHVHDPRSGEILNAHIQFYQNVENLQNAWYFTQASAADPRARRFPFPEDLMGRLLEYVLAHEVGHTLGFQHNMKASSTYPVDSLRSASFLRQWGHTPTLMDYSRFNYLVQPEDNVPVELLTPDIGPYDKWATMWGYKPIPTARTPEAERATLDEWAREQDTKPWLRFSTSGSSGSDPGELTEAVGEADAVKATGWGLANIKRQVAWLMPATTKPTENYDDLNDLYGRLIGQWRTELGHVAAIVGGADSQEKYGSQNGVRFTPVARARQKQAVAFLNQNAFQTPTFFLVEDILRRIEPNGSVARILSAQSGILNSLLQNNRLIRLSEYEHGMRPGTAYSVMELLSDVRGGLFAELRSNGEIDVYRRSLQRAYVEALDTKINPPPASTAAVAVPGGGRGGAPQLDARLSDIYPAVRAELRALDAQLRDAAGRSSGMKRAHLEDLRYRIEQALNPKS
jgi:hypothetical protein